MNLPEWIFLFTSALIAGANLWFALVSFREGEQRAGKAALLSMLIALPFIGLIWVGDSIQILLLIVLAVLLVVLVILFFLPVVRKRETPQVPAGRIDERIIMFARMMLRRGSSEYERYYGLHPEHHPVDERIRQHAGLLSRDAPFSSPVMTAAAEASFATVAQLRSMADGIPAAEKVSLSPRAASEFVLALAKQYGALDAGIARLEPYHIYSHIGRGEGEWGAEIVLPHAYAIAFTVEMSAENIGAAPRQPVTLESARQYVNAGVAAVQLAEALRRMGYSARAHIDGNYRVICPLVARDAGLGEIGRMGILMTPRQGPRVRIGVVTTDLPLVSHTYVPDESVFDFCRLCKKCAENCPSRSIPLGEREVINGALRWQIDQASCYEYWTRIGTDCGRCMAVCPYAHADNIFHNIIRYGVAHSANFRRAASAMDDFFYGRKPSPHPAPDWLQKE